MWSSHLCRSRSCWIFDFSSATEGFFPPTAALTRSRRRRKESHPIVDGLERRACHVARPRRAVREDAVELGWVVEVAAHPFGKRRRERGDHLGEVLLQVPVSA